MRGMNYMTDRRLHIKNRIELFTPFMQSVNLDTWKLSEYSKTCTGTHKLYRTFTPPFPSRP